MTTTFKKLAAIEAVLRLNLPMSDQLRCIERIVK